MDENKEPIAGDTPNEKAEKLETLAPPTGEPIAVTPTPPASETRAEGDPGNDKKKPKSKFFWIGIAAAVIIMIALIASCGSTGSSSSSNSSKSSASISKSSSSSSVNKKATEAEIQKLKDAIEEAKGIDLSEYTPETAEKVTVAISNGESLLAREGAYSSDINSAISQINSAKSSLKKPTVFKGSGDEVIDIPADLSTCLVTADYDSGRNFIIKSLSSSGSTIDLLVNTIGSYHGTTTTGMKSGTPAFLEVQSSGPWTITLKPVSEAATITSGQIVSGDNVVKANTGSAKKLTITNNGEHNFVVYGISSSSSKLLVNEIGSYSGTVINNDYKLFVVQSEGDWSISW